MVSESLNGNLFQIKDFSVLYGDVIAVRKTTLNVETNKITAMIGPSGCGKTTLLRCLNRMNDLIPTCRAEGQALVSRYRYLPHGYGCH